MWGKGKKLLLCCMGIILFVVSVLTVLAIVKKRYISDDTYSASEDQTLIDG